MVSGGLEPLWRKGQDAYLCLDLDAVSFVLGKKETERLESAHTVDRVWCRRQDPCDTERVGSCVSFPKL
jgi:hypothetical protein